MRNALLAGTAWWAAPAITTVTRAVATHTSGVGFQSMQYLVQRTGNRTCTVAQVPVTTADAGCQPANFLAGQSTAAGATAASLTVTCSQKPGNGNRINTVTFTIGNAATNCHFVTGSPPGARDQGGAGACTTGSLTGPPGNEKVGIAVPSLDRNSMETAIVRLVISCP